MAKDVPLDPSAVLLLNAARGSTAWPFDAVMATSSNVGFDDYLIAATGLVGSAIFGGEGSGVELVLPGRDFRSKRTTFTMWVRPGAANTAGTKTLVDFRDPNNDLVHNSQFLLVDGVPALVLHNHLNPATTSTISANGNP